MSDDSNNLNKKDVYNRLWDGRDFEIEHLWQRSVFLGAFLILFFTVYFTVFGSLINTAGNSDSSVNQSVIEAEVTMDGTSLSVMEKEEPESIDILDYLSKNGWANFGLLIISLLGASFSLLWIFMAKGSKYWYEKYEGSIDYLHEDENLFDCKINDEWRKEEIQALLDYREARHIPIQGYLANGDSNDSILRHKGGAYSMSKVNVTIGQLFLFFWLIAAGTHCAAFIPFSETSLFIVIALGGSLVLFVVLSVLLSIGNRSGESDWTNLFRVFRKWGINSDKKAKGIRKKRNENKWFIELLEKYPDSERLGSFFNVLLLDRNKKRKREGKIKIAVKHPMDEEHEAWMLTFMKENVFTQIYPEGARGIWSTPERQQIAISSRDDWKRYKQEEERYLTEIYRGPSMTSSAEKLCMRSFTDIPYSEINKKENCGINSERSIVKLEGAEEWHWHYVLCDNDDKMLCSEEFNFKRKYVGDKERHILSSVIYSEDGSVFKEFCWTKSPAKATK